MKNKIFKSLLSGMTDEKFLREYCGSGVTSFVSWDRLKPYVEYSVGKKPTEKIVGFIIDEKGITVKFERKK